MRAKGQTSIHLLLASIVTMYGTLLILTILALSWEPWMIPVILTGNTLVWILHIGRTGSDSFYENLCVGLLMIGFFFFGVHSSTLFDVPAVACMLILVFSMFDKKRLLFMTAALYVLILLYHFFILHTIGHYTGTQNLIRLGLGAIVISGAIAIARYRINRRQESRNIYDSTLTQLETAGRQNAEFLSNVSHELRTPINMVLGLSEVILEKDISPGIRTDMQSIQLAGKRLSNQINNMLDYTEIVEGTLTPAKEPYMITSVLNDIITMTAMQNSKHQLEMVFDLDPRTPAVLIGDAEKISHVLKILLENSIKFTEEGGINICIGYRCEDYGINLVIDIYDTGIGMTASQLTQMCDDFYQADSGSRFAGGLGLGLPIARGLLHAMGGFIHFDSRDRQGLHAHITIPQGVKDATPAMVLSHPERLCVACYFRTEKYASDEIRRYYDNMILHMVEGLCIEGYQAHNFEGLLKLQKNHELTHVFIAQVEYEENRSYYENLACTLRVVVIAERDYTLDPRSRLLTIHKPFFALSVVNLLNGEIKENGFGEAQAAGRKPFSCDGVRVLAVDDEEMNLVVAKGVLGSYGIKVDTCLSGKEAIERCTNASYDIIFLDHMMPGFDGVETLKRIREVNNGMYQERPVIALTANTISGAREMFRNEGFTEFIPKPIERAVLERVLRKVLPKQSIQYETEAAEFGKTPDRAAPKRGKSRKSSSGKVIAANAASKADPNEDVLTKRSDVREDLADDVYAENTSFDREPSDHACSESGSSRKEPSGHDRSGRNTSKRKPSGYDSLKDDPYNVESSDHDGYDDDSYHAESSGHDRSDDDSYHAESSDHNNSKRNASRRKPSGRGFLGRRSSKTDPVDHDDSDHDSYLAESSDQDGSDEEATDHDDSKPDDSKRNASRRKSSGHGFLRRNSSKTDPDGLNGFDDDSYRTEPSSHDGSDDGSYHAESSDQDGSERNASRRDPSGHDYAGRTSYNMGSSGYGGSYRAESSDRGGSKRNASRRKSYSRGYTRRTSYNMDSSGHDGSEDTAYRTDASGLDGSEDTAYRMDASDLDGSEDTAYRMDASDLDGSGRNAYHMESSDYDDSDDSAYRMDSFDDDFSENAFSEEDASEDTFAEDFDSDPDDFDDSIDEESDMDEFLPDEPADEYGTSISFTPLTKIGVNVQLGLDYCCGEEEFYIEMLQMFCTQAVEKREELIDLFEAANWTDYTVKVHALKSTSMTIGAELLAEQAKLLEQAGKKGNIGYIQHDHPTLIRLYDEVCETIAGL